MNEIETHNCELCGEPLMNSNICVWTCINDNCIVNNL